MKWKYDHVTVKPSESWYEVIRSWCADGWEPWQIEKNEAGWREIHFKRPATDFNPE